MVIDLYHIEYIGTASSWYTADVWCGFHVTEVLDQFSLIYLSIAICQVLQLHCSAVADYDLKLYFYSTQHPPWPWCWVFWWEDFQASIIRRNLWPFKAVLETRLQRARRRCRTIWTKLAIPHIFANISIGCKLNQVFQSHRIDRCVQMNLNDQMVQP